LHWHLINTTKHECLLKQEKKIKLASEIMKTEQELNILNAETKGQCEVFINALEALPFE